MTKPRPFDRGSWGPAANSTRKRCRPRLGLTGRIGKGSAPGWTFGPPPVRTDPAWSRRPIRPEAGGFQRLPANLAPCYNFAA
jgi:hypothetical protein